MVNLLQLRAQIYAYGDDEWWERLDFGSGLPSQGEGSMGDELIASQDGVKTPDPVSKTPDKVAATPDVAETEIDSEPLDLLTPPHMVLPDNQLGELPSDERGLEYAGNRSPTPETCQTAYSVIGCIHQPC